MYNYKMLIQYDGGRYKGWQRLGNDDNTIQGKIEHVISEMVGVKREIIGCSRTDAGVHAYAQTANFKVSERLSETEVKRYLNRYLPKDISVLSVTSVTESFHSRYHAKDKTYLYKIWNEEFTNPFMRKYSMHVEKKLNTAEMKLACQYFIGEIDFTAFSNARSKTKTMLREIYDISIEEEAGFVHIRIRGNGFLHNMVRRIVGTLIEVGLGEMDSNQITRIINSRERNQTGSMAEACGLFLEKIEY